MSFSNPILENPCKKFIDFKSDNKQFVYWDKELGENGEQVIIPTPIYFIVLDELTTVTGYYKEGDCGIYSNEIHFLKDEVLKVRTFKKGGPQSSDCMMPSKTASRLSVASTPSRFMQ